MSSLLGAQTDQHDDTAATSTASRSTRTIGLLAVVGLITLLLFAFIFSPPDERLNPETGVIVGQFDAVRLLYVHVPVVIIAYLAFSVTAIGSAMYLWKRSEWWDTVAGASGEIGVLLLGLTLMTGSIWGRPIWNTWWEWGDVRLMTTLMLFLMFLGYVAVRALDIDRDVRARRSAIVALISVLNIPIVSQSVNWWEDRTLHQQSTFAELEYQDLTLFTLVLGIVVFGLIWAWLLMHRFRVGWLEAQVERYGYETALAERRAEADRGVAASVGLDEHAKDSNS